jgi:putative transposase
MDLVDLDELAKDRSRKQRVIRDLNHKVSNKIIELAIQQKADIALEDLTGVREAPNRSKLFRTFLNSWRFYQLRQFIEYKANWNEIDIFAIDPGYTSQDCSSCGARTKCKGKAYTCKKCGLKIHIDENASYNIADRGYAMRATIYKHGNRVKPDSNLALIRD